MDSLVLIQGPMDPVVSLETAKRHLRVDTSADDDRIRGLVEAATHRLDGRDGLLGRALNPQTWELQTPCWPARRIVLALPPLIGVTSVSYLDETGTETTLDASLYRVINTGGIESYIMPAIGATWPNVASDQPDAVRVRFDAGYQNLGSPSDNAVPGPIRQAILLMVHSWFDRPGLEDIPEAAASLIAPYKANRLGASNG